VAPGLLYQHVVAQELGAFFGAGHRKQTPPRLWQPRRAQAQHLRRRELQSFFQKRRVAYRLELKQPGN